MTPPSPLVHWHRLVAERDPAALDQLLADDVVFHSPVVFTPQHGKPLTTLYLTAALHVFGRPQFRYVREFASATEAVLEFETELDGTYVNGVDMMRWNEAGQIVEFKVMLRPLQAVNLIHRLMGAFLQGMSGEPSPPSDEGRAHAI